MRNAIHRELTTIFGTQAWYSEWRFKRAAPSMIANLIETAGRLVRDRKPVDPPHIVAGLHFGFWTQLLKKGPDGNYTRHFWNAGVSEAFRHFPGGARGNQGRINSEILALKDFRNRIARHELETVCLEDSMLRGQPRRQRSAVGGDDRALDELRDAELGGVCAVGIRRGRDDAHGVTTGAGAHRNCG